MVMQSDSRGRVYVRCILGISFDRRGGVADVVEELGRFDSRFFALSGQADPCPLRRAHT